MFSETRSLCANETCSNPTSCKRNPVLLREYDLLYFRKQPVKLENIFIITARKRSLGQGNSFYPCLSVILSTVGWWYTPPVLWADTFPQADTSPPAEIATEAGGTHPTGMHSCCTIWLVGIRFVPKATGPWVCKMGGVTGCDGLGREVCVSGWGWKKRCYNDQSGLRILFGRKQEQDSDKLT